MRRTRPNGWDEKRATLLRCSTVWQGQNLRKRSANGRGSEKECGTKQPTHLVKSVVGVDLEDTYSHLHELDMETGETLSQTRILTTPASLQKHFAEFSDARIALKVGSHSPWSITLFRVIELS